MDLGGGSTEFVRGTGSVEAARSVDIGCVRMTERHLHSDPPTPDEVAAATADIEAAVDVALQAVPAAGVRTLVGLAGSVTTVTAQAWLPLRRAPHPPGGHAGRADAPGGADLLAMNRAHGRRCRSCTGRVDVIGAAHWCGTSIREVAERSGRGSELIVVSSEHDILDGLALSQVSAT